MVGKENVHINASPQAKVKWERALVQELGQVRDDWRPPALREERSPLLAKLERLQRGHEARSPLASPSGSPAACTASDSPLVSLLSSRLSPQSFVAKDPLVALDPDPRGLFDLASPERLPLRPRGAAKTSILAPHGPKPLEVQEPPWSLGGAESPRRRESVCVLPEPEHEGSPAPSLTEHEGSPAPSLTEHEGSPAPSLMSLQSANSLDEDIEALRSVVGKTPAKGCALLLAKLERLQRENEALRQHLFKRPPPADPRLDDLAGWAQRALGEGKSIADWLLDLAKSLDVDPRVPGTVVARKPDLEVLRRAAEAVRSCERARVQKMHEVKERLAQIAEAQAVLEQEAQQARAPRKLAAVELGRMLRMVELVARDLAFFADEQPRGWSFPDLARRHAESLQRGLPTWRHHVASL